MKPAKKENSGVNEEIIVVGIGASAGGLEALQDFFRNMPVETGLAFVVIQHLSPDYKSLMDELLARQTKIPIHVAETGQDIRPDNIYLIPPRKNMKIFHNKLFLEDQSPAKVLNLPVDIFMRSLALDKGKNAIGIILSGTGSDGTLGTRAIKEAGGMIMVQDDASAKFDGMPKSSIATGLVDYILVPAKMPDALVNYVKHPLIQKDKKSESILTRDIDTLTKIIMILRDFSGIDFSSYRENTILRRLERRVSINRFSTLDEYVLFLSESDKEKDILYRELLIGVTRFVRDIEAFDALKAKVFPELKKRKLIRIWSAGCSTGEEVYSLAILLTEYLRTEGVDCEVKIFATDIDRHSLDQASAGVYPESIIADLDPYLLSRYFTKQENGYQINDSIRQMVVFAKHNLIKDPPFSKLDMLVCRNLFIYLKPEVQTRLLAMFYYSLSPDGFLFLGSSESIGDLKEAFENVDTKWKIFRYRQGFNPPIIKDLRTTPKKYETEMPMVMPVQHHGLRLEHLSNALLSSVLPPSVLIDVNGIIVQTINDVSQFVQIQPGWFSNRLLDNLPREMSLLLSAQLRRLKKDKNDVLTEEISGLRSLGEKSLLLETRKIETEKTFFYLVSFKLKETPKGIKRSKSVDLDLEYGDRLNELQKELQSTKESLQATVEELETSNEELQSSNEELIASNEELQSTNEELQSVNEELFTVNSEFQIKLDELTRLNTDINNLLLNTQIGALYLDRNLCIRRLTPVVSKLTNIIPSDIGRPITHISASRSYPDMLSDIEKVVETLQMFDREVVFPEGVTYLVSIRPYRTENNVVEGIILTFVEITKLNRERARADELNRYLSTALEVGNMAWWRWDLVKDEVFMDDRKATMLGYTKAEFPSNVYEICKLIHPDDYEITMQKMRDHLTGLTPQWDCTYRIRRKDGSYAWYYDHGVITERNGDKPLALVGTVIDVSLLKEMELKMLDNQAVFDQMFSGTGNSRFLVNRFGRVLFANDAGILLSSHETGKDDGEISKIDGFELLVNDTGETLNPFREVSTSHQAITGVSCRLKGGDPEKIYSLYAVPLFDGNREFDGLFMVLN